MATLQAALSSVLLVLLLAHARTAATSQAMTTLEDICKRFARGHQAGHDYDYCMKTLAASAGSANGDVRVLAADTVNTALSAAKATSAGIARLQRAETVPARRDCLNKCAAEYDAAAHRLPNAAWDAYMGSREHVQEALRILAEALGAPLRCDRAFAAAGQRSPLSSADHEVDEAIGLALSILRTP